MKHAKIPFETFSEGIYCLVWEGFDLDNGTIIRGLKCVMNCCLYEEALKIENELRKSKIILTKINSIKNSKHD